MKIVAVTSCPTGIAHTYMAAEALEQAAKDAGHEIQVETQGAAGAEAVADADIAAADAVVFAADVEVRNRERFAGKPLVQTSVKRAINDPTGLIAEAEAAARTGGGGGVLAGAAAEASESVAMETAARPETKVDQGAGLGTKLRQWLMTGVSYMIPFVAAGGILIALAFLIGGPQVANKVNGGTFEGVEYQAVTDLSKLVVQAGYAGLLVQDRRRRLLHAGPDPGRLHRLRHGRPAGPGRRHRRRPDRGRDQCRVPRRPGRRSDRRRGGDRPSSGSRCHGAWPASCRWWSSPWCRP